METRKNSTEGEYLTHALRYACCTIDLDFTGIEVAASNQERLKIFIYQFESAGYQLPVQYGHKLYNKVKSYLGDEAVSFQRKINLFNTKNTYLLIIDYAKLSCDTLKQFAEDCEKEYRDYVASVIQSQYKTAALCSYIA